MSVTKKAIENAERALDNLKSMHQAITKEYGSELCADQMIKQEDELRKEIEDLKKQYESGKDN